MKKEVLLTGRTIKKYGFTKSYDSFSKPMELDLQDDTVSSIIEFVENHKMKNPDVVINCISVYEKGDINNS